MAVVGSYGQMMQINGETAKPKELIGMVLALAADYGSVFDEASAAYGAVELRRAAALFRDAADLAGADVTRRSEALVWSGVAA